MITNTDVLEFHDSSITYDFARNADSVVQGADGSLLFAKPMETTEKFTDFLDYVRNQQLEPTEGEVRYAQTRT